jgi:hypothetical protein
MQLPTAESLGQAPQLRSQNVVPIQLGRAEQSQAQAAETDMRAGQAIAGAGQTLFDIGQRIQEREDRQNYVTEKSNFLQSMVAAETEIGAEGDTDYKTYHIRLDEKLKKAKQEAMGKIKNPSMRLQFEADADLDIQQGIGRMAAKSWTMERSNGVAAMQTTLAKNRELYLTAVDDGTRASILNNSKGAIEMARQNGYISPEQAEEMGRKSAEDYAIGRVSVLPPAERIAVLASGGTLADFIPADQRQALTEKAQSEALTDLRNLEWMAQQSRETLFNNASLSVEQTGSVSQIPPGQWAAMDKSQRDSLTTYARDIAEGNHIPTDWNTYYQLKTKASNPETRKAFEREDLTKYRGKLGPTEYKELIGAQASLREGKTDKKLDGYLTHKQIVDDTLAGISIDPTPKPGTAAKQVAEFRRMVDTEITARQTQTGKEATNEEVQQIVDNLIVKGRVPVKNWFDDEKHRFQLKPGESLIIEDVNEVPAAERKEIEDRLRAKGKSVSDDNILRVFNGSLAKEL